MEEAIKEPLVYIQQPSKIMELLNNPPRHLLETSHEFYGGLDKVKGEAEKLGTQKLNSSIISRNNHR